MCNTVCDMTETTQKLHQDFSTHSSLLVGVLSDTHGFINEEVQIQLSKCDVILHAGDIGSIQVIDQLKKISRIVIPVCGNNDVEIKWATHEHAALNKILDIADIKFPGGNVIVMHGDQYFSAKNRHEKMRQHYPNAKAIIYGHSHKLVCDFDEHPWVLNPGAAGKTRTKGGASCLILQTNEKQWQVREFRSAA